MPNRQAIANFLQGLFVLPLCVLFGLMTALLFHWHEARQLACVGFCVLFPMAGAVKTKQMSLLAGLIAGAIVSFVSYFALKPHA